MNRLDLTGNRYGRLVAVSETLNYTGRTRWDCVCDCGNRCSASVSLLRNGKTKSCGCLRRELGQKRGAVLNLRHGNARKGLETAEYRTWDAMVRRCTPPTHKQWEHYGGRGITVCQEWLVFDAFLADMGPRPGPRLSLDRIDNEQGYSKENCRWATYTQQNLNKRNTPMITIGGETAHLNDWLADTGMSSATFYRRLHAGMSPEEALRTPVAMMGRKVKP